MNLVLLSNALTVVVTLHLAAVYLSMMAPLVCLWLQWRAGRDEVAARLDRYFLRLASAMLIAATVLGGLAILLVARLFPNAYLAAAKILPERRYWYGAVEIAFSLGCYSLALAMSKKDLRSRVRFWMRWLTTLLGSSNLIYHFPTLFVMLGVLCVRPKAWGQEIKFTTLLADSEILGRTIHHLLAALLVTGIAAAWYGLHGGDEQRRAVAWGGRIAAAAVVLQFLSGIWLVTVMPVQSRELLMGGDAVAACLFVGSLLAAIVSVARLGAMSLGHAERKHAMITIGIVLVILFGMTAVRHRTRDILLEHQRGPARQAIFSATPNTSLRPIHRTPSDRYIDATSLLRR